MCLQQADMPTTNDSRDSKLKVCRCFLLAVLDKADSLHRDVNNNQQIDAVNPKLNGEELTARKQNMNMGDDCRRHRF